MSEKQRDPRFIGVARLAFSGAALVSTWTGVSFLGIQPVDILLLLTATLSLFILISSKRAIWIPWWLVLPTAVILLEGFVQTVLPTDPSYLAQRTTLLLTESRSASVIDNLRAGLQWIAALAILPVLGGILAPDDRGGKQLILNAWALGATICSLIAVSDALHFTSIGAQLIGGTSIEGRQSGLASSPNNLGFSAVLGAPIALRNLLAHGKAWAIALAILVAGTYYSGSRTAQVAIVVVLVMSASVLFRRYPIAATAISTVVVALAVLVVSAAGSQDSSALIRFSAADSAAQASDEGRSVLADQAVRDFQFNPISGIGLRFITTAHSVPLQLAAAGGILLIIAFGAYLLVALAWCIRLSGRNVDARLITIILIAWISQALVQNQLVDRYLYFPIAALVAILASGHSSPARPETAGTGLGGDQVEIRELSNYVVPEKD